MINAGIKNINNNLFIAVLFLGTAMLFFTQCSSRVEEQTVDVDRSAWPSIRSTNKLIVISDSGMVKFRVFAPVQEIFDVAEEPYWEFPKGITMERFNPGMEKLADIKSDYAHYSVKDELWKWENNVVATNSRNEIFETEVLFWDQKKEKVYSDEFIKITLKEGFQTGYGFESNQDFTRYTIKQSQAEFPFEMQK